MMFLKYCNFFFSFFSALIFFSKDLPASSTFWQIGINEEGGQDGIN